MRRTPRGCFMADFRLETARLVLRDWRDEDLTPFHEICSDPAVMATLGPVMSREEAAAQIARNQARADRDGYTLWALERRSDGALIGSAGVIRGAAGPVDGKAEIGWRLASGCWGEGYASEAARATAAWAFANLGDDALWAITSVGNARSRAVMERLGMTHCEDLDFDHPHLPAESPLLRHVAYRLERPA